MNALKYLLIFASGIGIGGAVSTLFYKKKYENFISREEHDADLAAMDEYYASLQEGVDEGELEDDFEEVVESKDRVVEKRKGSFATDYASYYGDKKEKVDPAENEHPDDDEPTREKRGSRVISAKVYGSEGYAERVLYYYTEDDDLVPEGESFGEVIDADEVKDMIGNALIKYGFADEGNTDRDMFVRNFDRKTDYHIIKVIGSLSEDGG